MSQQQPEPSYEIAAEVADQVPAGAGPTVNQSLSAAPRRRFTPAVVALEILAVLAVVLLVIIEL